MSRADVAWMVRRIPHAVLALEVVLALVSWFLIALADRQVGL